jgi:hypothetical protein
MVAVVFAIATEPGVMAMPQSAPHNMVMNGTAMTCCDHQKPEKPSQNESGTPCKNMAVCGGMMSCFGMAALAVDHPLLRTSSKQTAVHFHPQTAQGLTLQPDNPPPIA